MLLYLEACDGNDISDGGGASSNPQYMDRISGHFGIHQTEQREWTRHYTASEGAEWEWDESGGSIMRRKNQSITGEITNTVKSDTLQREGGGVVRGAREWC